MCSTRLQPADERDLVQNGTAYPADRGVARRISGARFEFPDF